MTSLVTKLNLEQLIDQQIELGHKNPHDFPDLLERAVGEDLAEIVKPYIADFITEMGRHRINNRRRASVAKITNATISSPDIMLQSLWVPAGPETTEITYKAIGEMTAEDFNARADYLERMAIGIHIHANWCRQIATTMKAANVQTAGELGQLPPLPDLEDL